MTPNLLSRAHHANPQLWLELKYRLKWRNILATVTVSLLGQFFIVALFQKKAVTEMIDDWQGWNFDVFHTLTWIAVLLLLTLGSYWLVKDVAREYRRGTLTLVRLTPQASRTILVGKLLGVPILLYLAIALAIPLHLWTAIKGGVSLQTLIVVYSSAAIACGFTYTYGLVYALGWEAKTQAWYVEVLAVTLFGLLFLFWQFWRYVWRESAAGWDTFLLIHSVLLIVLSAASYKLWRMAIHRFHHPPRI